VARLGIPYEPFGGQIEAHAAPERHVLLAGGWGAGKTWWLIAEALRATFENPGVPGVLVSPTFRIQDRTLCRVIERMFPNPDPKRPLRWPRGKQNARGTLGPMVKDWSARERVLTLATVPTTRWIFASAEDPGSMEGAEYGWGVMDEGRLVTPEGWRIFNSRIRYSAPGVFHRRAVASVPTMGWLYDEFGKGVPGRRAVRVRTADNPHLDKSYIGSLNLSGRRALAFLEGQWVHLTGTVYETYQPMPTEGDAGSVVDHTPDARYESFGMLDFGRRRPYFGLVQDVPGLATDGSTGQVVCEEVVGSDLLSEAHAHLVAEMLKGYGVIIGDVYCDPAGETANEQTGIPDIQVYERVLKNAGVMVGNFISPRGPTERYLPNGIEATRSALQNHRGVRRLFVAAQLADSERRSRYGEKVVGIHDALLGYKYPDGGRGGSAAPAIDRPLKDGVHDHPCDALRYYTVGRWGVMTAPDLDPFMRDGRIEGASSSPDLEDFDRW